MVLEMLNSFIDVSSPGMMSLDGIELVFLPVGVLFWIQYEENANNTDVFSCGCEIKDFFPVSHNQLISRCREGA